MGGAVDGGQTKRGCGEWKLVEVVRGPEPSQGHVASGAVRGCRGDHEGRGRRLGLLWRCWRRRRRLEPEALVVPGLHGLGRRLPARRRHPHLALRVARPPASRAVIAGGALAGVPVCRRGRRRRRRRWRRRRRNNRRRRRASSLLVTIHCRAATEQGDGRHSAKNLLCGKASNELAAGRRSINSHRNGVGVDANRHDGAARDAHTGRAETRWRESQRRKGEDARRHPDGNYFIP